MSGLGQDIQVIIQMELPTGGFSCEGFTGFPVVNPCLISIATAGTSASYRWADDLRQELVSSLSDLGQGFASVSSMSVPCGGIIGHMHVCHAHSVVSAQKLLILVGDPVQAFTQLFNYEAWANLGESYRVLPVFPVNASVATLLPSADLKLRNAVFWQNTISEVVPGILSSVGLIAEDRRLFISYYRPDSQELADQLFDALSHANFDVYLDRFRTPPAVDFQRRLEQELADKAMVLILESSNLAQSKWCRHEIDFAKRRRLGLLALQVPGGMRYPGIGSGRRLRLQQTDFKNRTTLEELTDLALSRVVKRVIDEHAWSMVYRRWYIRRSMELALRSHGVRVVRLDPDGLLRMQSLRMSKEYAFWLTTRSPDVSDFHKTDINLTATEQGVVIGPGAIEVIRQDRLNWLSQKSNILVKDEGLIFDIARDAKDGWL